MNTIKKIYENMIFRVIIISLILLAIISFGLENFIFKSEIYSRISNSDWGLIIGGYVGAVAGGIISIMGIWYQLNKEKEKEIENVKLYINHILKKLHKCNEEKQENYIEKINEGQKFIKYFIQYSDGDYDFPHITEFNSTYIENNLNIILSLKEGEEILDLSECLNRYNIFIKKGRILLNEKTNICKKLEEECDKGSLISYFKILVGSYEKNFSDLRKKNDSIKKMLKTFIRKVNEEEEKLGYTVTRAYIDLAIINKNLEKIENENVLNYERDKLDLIEFFVSNFEKITNLNNEKYKDKLSVFYLNDLNIIEKGEEIKKLINKIPKEIS